MRRSGTRSSTATTGVTTSCCLLLLMISMMLLLLLLVMMMPLRHCREHLLTNRVGHRRHLDVSVCPLKCIPVGFCVRVCGGRRRRLLVHTHTSAPFSYSDCVNLERSYCCCWFTLFLVVLNLLVTDALFRTANLSLNNTFFH